MATVLRISQRMIGISGKCVTVRKIISKSFLPNSRFYSYEALSQYCQRTHTCGELKSSHVDERVVLYGWVQYQRGGKFITLRDSYGVTQLLIPDKPDEKISKPVHKLSFESVVKVTGVVKKRPYGQANVNMTTGDIEVSVEDFEVLNKCKQILPFEVKEFFQANENLRMRYRYLDIRNLTMQQNLRLRSNMNMKMREYLCNQNGFVDVETPCLFRRTPGGAREFIVPTHQRGEFYSLPQSPQQFKQLLMIGGIDRYMQIAKCFRDEGSGPERQPEFTQLDLEMSFVNQKDIQDLVEELLHYSWPDIHGSVVIPFPRMTYDQAVCKYGTDKPDTRFDMTLVNLTEKLRGTEVKVFQDGLKDNQSSIRGVNIKGGVDKIKNKDIERLQNIAKEQFGLGGLTCIKCLENGDVNSPVMKFLRSSEASELVNTMKAFPGDLIFIAAGDHMHVCSSLGNVRIECANLLEQKGMEIRSRNVFNFLWVTDFPLFLPKEDNPNVLESAHHPFTAPHSDHEQLLYSNPAVVKGQHYDLVLNGNEIGGGSIRIHNSKMQRYILETILKEDSSSLNHLLEALDSGCPPHGGIALGLDRLFAIIVGANSIRDVIAFPKTYEGRDPMSQAPAEVSKEDLDYYHIKINKDNPARIPNDNVESVIVHLKEF